MKNLPKRIYLQIDGGDSSVEESITDWNDLFASEITWSENRINDSDIEFVLSDFNGKCELPNVNPDNCSHDWVWTSGYGNDTAYTCSKCKSTITPHK